MAEDMEVGQRTRELQDFEQSSKDSRLKRLNTQPLSWSQKLKRAVLGGAVASVAIGGAVAMHNAQKQENSYIGMPVSENSQPYEAELHQVPDNEGKMVGPFFHDGPTEDSHTLSIEELKQRGVDLSLIDNKVKVELVKGGTYNSSLKAGQMEDENGRRYGEWGKVVVTINGVEKDTGIFVAKNYLAEVEPVSPPAPNK